MAEKMKTEAPKAKKLADPVAATIDPASQQMIQRAHDLGVETAFDRAVTLKPCNIGNQGICCKNCGMGPCRLPLPKGGIEGEDTRKGLCGATANTIAARNFARMVAAGAAAHSDHGRSGHTALTSTTRHRSDDISGGDVYFGIRQYDQVILGPAHTQGSLQGNTGTLVYDFGHPGRSHRGPAGRTATGTRYPRRP